MTPPAALVIGAAVGYAPTQIQPFLSSLRAAGYAGPVALIVAHDFPSARERPFDGVLWVRRPRPWAARWQRRMRRVLASVLGPLREWRLQHDAGVPDWALAVVRNYHHPSVSRYADYFELVRDSNAQWIVLSDVRDVIFQQDPVAGLSEPALYVSIESIRYTLGSEPFNRKWITRAYGEDTLKRIADAPVSCSGVTLGDRASVLDYLGQMVREIVRLTPRIVFDFGYDQAAHNVILNRAAPPARIIRLHTLESAVATINGTEDAELQFDDQGRLLNRDGGQVVAIVHQYDRNSLTRSHAEALVKSG